MTGLSSEQWMGPTDIAIVYHRKISDKHKIMIDSVIVYFSIARTSQQRSKPASVRGPANRKVLRCLRNWELRGIVIIYLAGTVVDSAVPSRGTASGFDRSSEPKWSNYKIASGNSEEECRD